MTGRYGSRPPLSRHLRSRTQHRMRKETGRGIEAIDVASINPGTVLPAPVTGKSRIYRHISASKSKSGCAMITSSPARTTLKSSASPLDYQVSSCWNESEPEGYRLQPPIEMLVPGSVCPVDLNSAWRFCRCTRRYQPAAIVLDDWRDGKVLTPTKKADFARLSDQYLNQLRNAQRNLNARFPNWQQALASIYERVVKTGAANRHGKNRNHAILAFAVQWLKSRNIKTQQQLSAEIGNTTGRSRDGREMVKFRNGTIHD